MARKRMIDPDFWLDEEITSLEPIYRLFYVGTWNFADDYGVIENSAKKLKAQIFPYEDVDAQKILDKLIKLNKLAPFESDGKKWLYIRKFLKYQRVDKPSRNRNPAAPRELLAEDSESTQEPLNDEVKLSKEKLREVKLKEVNKNTYGEFEKVKLTTEEYQKLVLRLGEANTNMLIAQLDTGIESKGYKYKSHYATLLNWAARKFVEHKEKVERKTKTFIT